MDGPHAPGRVVVLNGPSSSGKTSIATQLQALPGAGPLLHVSLDAFRAMEPHGYWSEQSRPQWPLREEALCRAINAAAAAYARHGLDVLIDHVLPARAWAWMAQDLRGLPVVTVGIHCASAELARRELLRGDRPEGLAESQAERVHLDRTYDFELDTTSVPVEVCAQRLHAWLASQKHLPAA